MKVLKINLNRNSQRLVIAVLSVISLIGLLVIQFNWLSESVKMQEAIFSRGVNMALQNSIERDTLLSTQDVFSEEVISRLESAMQKELKQYHINLGFHILLINGEDTLSLTPIAKIKNKELIRHSISAPEPGAEIQLAIHFPGRSSFIVKRTASMFITSVILILFTIAAIFAILTFYIRERKFARQIKDMVVNLTHEFMTPVSSISLAANMLISRSGKSGDNTAVNLAMAIKEENKKLQRQTNRLLRLAEVESGGFDYDKKIINVNDVINDALNAVNFQLGNSGAMTNCEYKASYSTVLADESRLCDVFINLFTNSLKYNTENPVINIRTDNRENEICISVEDNGIGIPKREQKRIFEKYYRITNGNMHNTKGFGVGLYFAKTVIEGHGGRIEVESEPGRGSTFKIYLPVLKKE